MKSIKYSHQLVLRLLVIALIGLTVSFQAQEAIWTEVDSKLANRYLGILQNTPDNSKVLELLWDLYQNRNQTDLLLDYLGKAASAERAVSAKLIYAQLLRTNGRLDEARLYLEQVVSTRSKNVFARKSLAEIAAEQQRPRQALSLYNQLIGLTPIETEAGQARRLRAASLNQSLGQPDAAVAIWNELLSVSPMGKRLRDQVIAKLLEVGETEGVVKFLKMQAQAGDARLRLSALSELERLYSSREEFDNASRTCVEALALLHFKHHQYQHFFGRWVRLHERFDQLSSLEKRLRERVDIENPSEVGPSDLASFYRLTADPEKQQEPLVRLVKSLPKEIGYRVSLSEIQLANDQYQQADATLDAIFEAEESVPTKLVLLRAQIEVKAGRKDKAEQFLKDYLERQSSSPNIRGTVIEFARANYLDGLVERSLRESAIADPDATFDLVGFLTKRGRSDEVGEVLQAFIAADGVNADERVRRYHLASMAYRDIGELDQSMGLINQAIREQPENIEWLSVKAELQIDQGEHKAAIETLKVIWVLHGKFDPRTEVDQKIYSILNAFPEGGDDTGAIEIPDGSITTPAQFRQVARAISSVRGQGAIKRPTSALNHYY